MLPKSEWAPILVISSFSICSMGTLLKVEDEDQLRIAKYRIASPRIVKKAQLVIGCFMQLYQEFIWQVKPDIQEP